MNFLKKINWYWVRVTAEYVGVILLFVHLIPDNIISSWKSNGLAAIILLGTCLILSLRNNSSQSNKYSALELEREGEIKNNDQLKNKLAKADAYKEMFSLLNKAFSELHNIMRSDFSKERFKEAFKNFCTKLSYGFEKITDNKCHVCIKIQLKPEIIQIS